MGILKIIAGRMIVFIQRWGLFSEENKKMKLLILISLIICPLLIFGQFVPKQANLSDSSWKYVGIRGFSSGRSDFVSMALSPSGVPYVAYSDSVFGGKAVVMMYNGYDWINVGTPGFTEDEVTDMNLVFSKSSELYLGFIRKSNQKISVMKLLGNDWITVGNSGINQTPCTYFSLALTSTGEPYISFDDNNMLSVMKYNGTFWDYVGQPRFTGNYISFIDIKLDQDEKPYVAFRDNAIGGGYARVMKFESGSWIDLGSPYWAAGWSNWNKIGFDYADQLYIAYFQATQIINGETVRKFNGSDWIAVGQEMFFAPQPEYTSLAFNPLTNQPHVALCKAVQDRSASVLKFDGVNWVFEGPENISGGPATHTNLAIDSSGMQYIAFMDCASSNKASVMKYTVQGVGSDEPEINYISVFPNPVKSNLTIRLVNDDKVKISIDIFNQLGTKVLSQQIIEDHLCVDFSHFPAGIYYLTVTGTKIYHGISCIKQ